MSDIDKILNIKQTGLKLAAGNLLVSTPLLNDFYFGHCVILITEYDKAGSVGLILNKRTKSRVNELVPSLSAVDMPLFIGGPVNQDQVFYIHNNKFVENTLPIGNDLFWGGDLNQISDFIKDGIFTKNDIKFFLGYSGWSANQLETEIKTDSWVVTKPSNSGFIFQNGEFNLWKSIVTDLGSEYKKWFIFPTNPLDN